MLLKNPICTFSLKCRYATLYAIFCTLQSAILDIFVTFCIFALFDAFMQSIVFKEKERIERKNTVFCITLSHTHTGDFTKKGGVSALSAPLLILKGFL